MIKKYILLIFISIIQSVFLFSNESNILIDLSMNYNELIETLGEPLETKVSEFQPNHKFDTLIYCYKHLELSTYRINPKINQIKLSSSNYSLNIDNNVITCGLSKDLFDEIFGEGTLESCSSGYHFYYPLTDFREIIVHFDDENNANIIIYKYSDPE